MKLQKLAIMAVLFPLLVAQSTSSMLALAQTDSESEVISAKGDSAVKGKFDSRLEDGEWILTFSPDANVAAIDTISELNLQLQQDGQTIKFPFTLVEPDVYKAKVAADQLHGQEKVTLQLKTESQQTYLFENLTDSWAIQEGGTRTTTFESLSTIHSTVSEEVIDETLETTVATSIEPTETSVEMTEASTSEAFTSEISTTETTTELSTETSTSEATTHQQEEKQTLKAVSESASGAVPIYRLYNSAIGKHLYTTDSNEKNVLYTQHGWGYEGIGWYAPTSGQPVYRLYNPALKNHLYTQDTNEVRVLTRRHGWKSDNNGKPVFYSGGNVNVYRLYNRQLQGRHHWTTDTNEYKIIPQYGWRQEGIKFKATQLGNPIKTQYYSDTQQTTISLTPVNTSNYTFGVNIANAKSPQGIRAVKVAVWSEADGQNDLRWYTATKQSNGKYSALVRLSNHYYSNGKYQVHVYYELNNGQTVGVDAKTINVTTPAPRTKIQQELKILMNQFHSIFSGVGGNKSVYIAPTSGIETARYNDSVQRSASTIKLFIMAAAFAKANRGELDLNAPYTVRSSDIVKASVSLGNAAGRTYSLGDIIRFMVETSDNTATNIVMRHIGGVAAVNNEIRRMGYTKTYLQRYMHDPVAINAGLDNYINAQEAGDLIRNIYNRTLINRTADNKMVQNLSNNYYPLWLPANIQGRAYVIDKPGNNGALGVENDVAIIAANGRAYTIAVLTEATGSSGLSLTSRFARFGEAVLAQLSK